MHCRAATLGRVTGKEQAGEPGPEQLATRFAEGVPGGVPVVSPPRRAAWAGFPGASLAVLEHLAMAGPLTVRPRAAGPSEPRPVGWSSDIVSHLERQGLLEREERPGPTGAGR